MWWSNHIRGPGLCYMMVWGLGEAGMEYLVESLFLSLFPSSCPPLPYLFSTGLTWDFSQHGSLRVVRLLP